MKFPDHKADLHLTHNEHKNYYEKMEQFIVDHDLQDDFVSKEQFEKAVKDDSLWVLQWYPETPVGFCRLAGADLEEVLKKACEP